MMMTTLQVVVMIILPLRNPELSSLECMNCWIRSLRTAYVGNSWRNYAWKSWNNRKRRKKLNGKGRLCRKCLRNNMNLWLAIQHHLMRKWSWVNRRLKVGNLGSGEMLCSRKLRRNRRSRVICARSCRSHCMKVYWKFKALW